jgi:hypothetical protein
MMDIRILIGMPLWYAKSVLENNGLSYVIEETASRSHYFKCDAEKIYVIRAKFVVDKVHLLVNHSLEINESIDHILRDREGRP